MRGGMEGRKFLTNLVIAIMLTVIVSFGITTVVAVAETEGYDPETVVFSIDQKGYVKGDQLVQMDVAPYIKDIGNGLGRTMVPVAFVAPSLGTEPAQWFAEGRRVLITKGEKRVEIFIDSSEMLVNGKKVQMDASAEIVDVGGGGGRTMLPIAFVAQALEVGYEWKEDTREVYFYGKNVVFGDNVNYGPDTGTQTIEGNVIVKYPGVTLNNLVIKGNLVIAEEVGDGDVTLNNIEVKGETYIRGGGKDSIHIRGGVFRNVVVQNVGGQVRIVATAVNGLTVVIAEDAAGEEIILQGSFSSVVLEGVNASIVTQGPTNIGEITVRGTSGNPVITLSERTTVANMVLEGKAEVKGSGVIAKAEIKAAGVSFEKPPVQQTIAVGVAPPPTPPMPPMPPTFGGGSGDSGDSGDSSPPPAPPGPATYTLTLQINPTGVGSAADSTAAGPYADGATVNISAAANAGYEFVSWTSGGVIISTQAAFSYTMTSANTTLTANFLPEGYVPIATAAELNNLRNAVSGTYGAGTPYEGSYTGGLDKKYLQVADIDLGVSPYNSGAGWQPIGVAWSTPFTGVYDGNGFVIDNLFISRASTEGVGLFGYVGQEGLLKGSVLTNANVTGDEYVGILVGASEGAVDNCSSAGVAAGAYAVGGLVGVSYNFDADIERHALIKNSHSAVTVQTEGRYSGGLVGANYGKIENCFATGTVTATDFYAGGLAGENFGKITGSYAAGNVNGNGAGGLVGENYKNVSASKYEATIIDSYATGDVSGKWSIGGLVGYSCEGTINNCYATGNVSGEEGVAGLIGELSSGTISNSFALNAQITRTAGSDTHFARIIGWYSSGTLDSNYTRADMVFAGIEYIPVKNKDGKDGASISEWTIENGVVTDYILTPPSAVATVSSDTYTVGSVDGGAANIRGVPYQTTRADFLAALIKGNAYQTWNSESIADPVVSGNTLVVTAENGTTIVTYTVIVDTTLGEPTAIAAGAVDPSTTISLLNSTFTASAEATENWLINTGTTGLTVASITLQGAAGEATGVTVAFTGTVSAGTISFQALAASVASGQDTSTLLWRPLSNDTAVSSKETHYTVTVHATSMIPADNPIAENSIAITTATLVGDFTGRLNFPADAAYKVIDNATVTAAGGFETWDFDSMAGKLSTAKMVLHDVLLVRAVDGTLRGYLLEVVPQVFFSEYVEAGGTRQALEIYNETDSAIDLAALDFKIKTYISSGTIIVYTLNLTGTIASKGVFVVANEYVDSLVPGVVDQVHELEFDGNDVVVLQMGNLVLDRIGQMESYPPSGAWKGYDEVNEEWIYTKNQTLRRKPEVSIGDRNINAPYNPADEWVNLGLYVLGGLGSHDRD